MKKNNKTINTINKPSYTVEEVAKILSMGKTTVYTKINEGKLSVIPNSNPTLISDISLQKYISESTYPSEPPYKKVIKHTFNQPALDFDESLKTFNTHGISTRNRPEKYLVTHNYAVSNKGRIFNLENGKELSQSKAAHDYLQVVFSTIAGKVSERVHVVVANFWCANQHRKEQVHHIDGEKENNNASNLLYVNQEEHTKADKMLREAKKNNDPSCWSDYNSYINEIKKDNEYTDEYRCLTFEKSNCIIFAWIPKKDYDLYCSGKKSLDDMSTDIIEADRLYVKEGVMPKQLSAKEKNDNKEEE